MLEKFNLWEVALIYYFVIVFALYYLPTFYALWKNKQKKLSILVFNILLGWTIIGWAMALFWAIKNPVED
ncbi:MAG: superinfection immunity protein [Chitinophagales bacterium]